MYAPVFVLDYNGSHQSFIGNWYKKEESANREIKKLEQYYSPDSMQNSKFSYHIESENTIIHSLKSKDIFKKLRLSNFVHRFVNTDIELLSIVLFGVLTTSYTVGGWKFITNPIPLYLVLLQRAGTSQIIDWILIIKLTNSRQMRSVDLLFLFDNL